MATATEKATAAIPGSENMPTEHQTSLERVQGYPLVKDSLSQAYSIVHSTSLSGSAYDKAESIATSLLSKLQPLQDRLPLKTVDAYANSTLDYLEKKVPAVKDDTNVIVGRVRKPADDAVGIALPYLEMVQSRLSPVTDALHNLQGLLTKAASAVPRDQESAKAAVGAGYKELETRSTALAQSLKEAPAHVQASVQPLVDGLFERLGHVKDELLKPDTPIADKGKNVLQYSQSQIAPLLSAITDTLRTKKAEAEDTASAKVNGTN